MTMASSRVEKQPETAESLGARALRLVPDDDAFAEWLALRQDFVEKKGWRTGSTGEWDRYDEDPRTAQLIMTDAEGRLAFGMRLTPAVSIDDSLSWSMVTHSRIP